MDLKEKKKEGRSTYRVHTELDEDTYKRFRRHLLYKGQTVKSFLKEIILKTIERKDGNT